MRDGGLAASGPPAPEELPGAGALERVGRSRLIPARRRPDLAREMAADLHDLADHLVSSGVDPEAARQRAARLMEPSEEGIRELEALHGSLGGRLGARLDLLLGSGRVAPGPWIHPSGVMAFFLLFAMALLPALLLGPQGGVAGGWISVLLLAGPAALVLLGSLGLARQGWLAEGSDAVRWRFSLRLHLGQLLLLWSGTLLAVALELHHLLGRMPDGGGTAAMVSTLYVLVVLPGAALALTLFAGIHLALLIPRVTGARRARGSIQHLLSGRLLVLAVVMAGTVACGAGGQGPTGTTVRPLPSGVAWTVLHVDGPARQGSGVALSAPSPAIRSEAEGTPPLNGRVR